MTEVEQLAQDIGIDPRVLVRDFGARELATVARVNRLLDATQTKKPAEFLPLRSKRNGDFGEVAASIPEDLFFRLRGLGSQFGLMDMIRHRDLRALTKEYPVCRTNTVSGKIVSYSGRGGRWAGTRRAKFDRNVKFAE